MPMRRSWRGFVEPRNKLREMKLVETEKLKIGSTAMTMATVELDVKDLDKAGSAAVEVEGASAEAPPLAPDPDVDVSSFELALQRHETRLMSIGH